MLEILLVIHLSKKIAAMMKEKGRGSAGYIVLFVILWFGGEIVGGIAGILCTPHQQDGPFNNGGFDFTVYIFALIGAAIGGAIGYMIAHSMPPLNDPMRNLYEEFAEEDEFERSRARRRVADDGSFKESREP